MDIMQILKEGGITLLIIEILWWLGVAWFILSRRKKKLRKNKWL